MTTLPRERGVAGRSPAWGGAEALPLRGNAGDRGAKAQPLAAAPPPL
jgi:hypothetical protein